MQPIATECRNQNSMIIFLDAETGGLDAGKNPLLEIALKVVNAFSGELLGEYQSYVKIPRERWSCCHPRALEANGITRMDTLYGKNSDIIRNEIARLFQSLKIHKNNSCYICQNPTFDRGFFRQIFPEEVQTQLRWPCHWLDMASMNFAITILGMKMSGLHEDNICRFRIPFSKDGIARQHGLVPESKPHKAMNGVDHLMEIYKRIVGYPNQDETAMELC